MIKVLFFASLREQLNCQSLNITAEVASVAALKEQLLVLHPEWQEYFANASLLTAVNQAMCNENSAIKSGDEVAFFPPVTGG
ncbi:MAG: molybdopterin converting factor subunit 1 [Thalassotalea sp.]